MKKELQEKFFKKYPNLFAQRKLSKRESCMCYGIKIGDGWSGILETLCNLIKFNVEHNAYRFPKVEFTQIKQKLGMLRVYYTIVHRTKKEFRKILDAPELSESQLKKEYLEYIKTCEGCSIYIDGMIAFAEYLSQYVCEDCGANGAITRGKSWLLTLCDKCYKTRKAV